MTVDVLKGITTWGLQFGFAGILAGVSNAMLGWLGERKKWLREMKKAEWERLILDSEAAVIAARRMPRRQIPDMQRTQRGSTMHGRENDATDALQNAQALHQEVALKVEELQSIFNTRILIFPQLNDSGAIGAYTDLRDWFCSDYGEESAEEGRKLWESGGRMMAALRHAAYEDLRVNLSFGQSCQILVRRCKRYFSGRQYPDHLGKAV